MQQAKSGKKDRGKCKKAGRNRTSASNARRKIHHPDLRRKVKNVYRSCGPTFARAWVANFGVLDEGYRTVKHEATRQEAKLLVAMS